MSGLIFFSESIPPNLLNFTRAASPLNHGPMTISGCSDASVKASEGFSL